MRTDVSSPNAPATDLAFTGQRNIDAQGNAPLGLMDYNARMYDSLLARFIQPDTIISDQSSPQTWNRYSYVQNDPIGLTDPTGHHCADEDSNGNCPEDPGYDGGSNSNGEYTSGDAIGGYEPISGSYPSMLSGNTGGKSGSAGKISNNPCVGQGGHVPALTCTVHVTQPATVTPGQVYDPTGGESDAGSPEYQPPTAPDYIMAFISGFEYLHYNTPLWSTVTNSYVQGGILVIYNNNTGANEVPGIAVYNHTGMPVSVSGMSIDNENVSFSSRLKVPAGQIGLIALSSPSISIDRYQSIQVHIPFVVGTFGTGNIDYNGPIIPTTP